MRRSQMAESDVPSRPNEKLVGKIKESDDSILRGLEPLRYNLIQTSKVGKY